MSTALSRRSRIRVQSDNVLGTARTIAQLTKDVTDIAKVPIASQVASLVLSLLEIAKEVKDNNDARVRLASTAATYLVELGSILASRKFEETVSEALMDRMERFHETLLELKYELEALRKRNILKRLWGKERIATKLLDHEKALHASYSALLMWTVTDTNIAVRSFIQSSAPEEDADEYERALLYNTAEVRPLGTIKGACGVSANAALGEARGQRLIVKRVSSKREREQEVRKWSKIWHPNIPHMAGYTTAKSGEQLILFHDYWFDERKRMTYIGSVAASLLKMTKTDDAFSIVDTLIDYVNDAISAFRHMQRQLNLTEGETAFLVTVTRYTLSSDGRIIVTPPLQNLAEDGDGIKSRVYWTLFPGHGTGEGSMRRYFAELDGSPGQASSLEAIDDEQLEKWASIDGILWQARFLSDKIEKPQEYVMPETRWAFADYSADVRPGDFGVFDPGEDREYAFRRVASPFDALFPYQSDHSLCDRNEVDFDLIQRKPMTWKLGRLTDGCLFTHERKQRLTNEVHRAKRFLELSAPKNCSRDELVFVVSCARYYVYGYTHNSGLAEEPQMAGIYAELQDPDNDKLCFSCCDPSVCLEHSPLDGQIGTENYSQYIRIEYATIRIEYVTIPVGKSSANLEIEKKQDPGHSRHREYESIVQRRHTYFDERSPPWKEWP